MDESKFEDKLTELVKEFGAGGDSQYNKLSMLAKRAHENNEKLKKNVESLHEALDYLRVCIKYQLFDLEATRRENKYLRSLLENGNK